MFHVGVMCITRYEVFWRDQDANLVDIHFFPLWISVFKNHYLAQNACRDKILVFKYNIYKKYFMELCYRFVLIVPCSGMFSEQNKKEKAYLDKGRMTLYVTSDQN